ncbi:AcvB/VirJ family lysyl-phosphatidylglycerol hydrolase [Aeromonas media]|uniref:Virulence factor n=1 Tax=Aeromonas media TaxID=651 RepID=A0AAW5RKR8_AERME|nr:AcvB/VirJ family lysyl-phosphatidylglycerol hydrolase [Aeromonas media]MCV3288769.1 virulence factor [Aeromonas media]QJT34489.1 virulence factor [Aeromonas media]QJT40065.1 virulence factor [Aeromonas media]
MRAMLLLLICCLVSSFTLPAVAAQPSRVGTDLGLVELPVAQASSAPMVVFMSGDGGWAALDKGLSAELQRHGMPVVGWSSLSYYWKKKTPEQATADLVRILSDYQSRWGRQRWLLVGFSFGAEIVPFVINRLPQAYRNSLVGAVMLSPSTASDFEIHVSDMVVHDKAGSYPTLPEVKAIKSLPLLCVQGADDDSPVKLCPHLQQPNVTTVTLPGSHHFDDDYGVLYRSIADRLPWAGEEQDH